MMDDLSREMQSVCRKADAGCLTEKACVTHGDPPGLRATVKLWRRSRAPAVPRVSMPRRFPLNNSRLIFLTHFLTGKAAPDKSPLFHLRANIAQMIAACFF